MGREARRNKDQWKTRPRVLDRFVPEVFRDDDPPRRISSKGAAAAMALMACAAMVSPMNGRKLRGLPPSPDPQEGPSR